MFYGGNITVKIMKNNCMRFNVVLISYFFIHLFYITQFHPVVLRILLKIQVYCCQLLL